MKVWATDRKGNTLCLGEPGEAELTYDREAPADLLEAVFPGEQWPELVWVTVELSGRRVFWGLVDEQNLRVGPQGRETELVCRSGEALLLDSEAPPETLSRPSLEKLERLVLQGLGLSRVVGDRSQKQGQLTVEKGMSCWEAVEEFCRGWLGTVPYVDETGALRCDGLPSFSVDLGTASWGELSFKPCKELSEVWQQSFRGTYDTPYRRREAAVQRRRYCSSQSGEDPKETLAQGLRESWQLTVECPGSFWPLRGANAWVEVPGLGKFENCPVREARWLWDRQGARTQAVLERGEGPCG